MIKLNLLPRYVTEFRRMKIFTTIFLVVLVIEAAVTYKVLIDMKAQAEWFAKDKAYFETRKTMIEGEKQKADELAGTAGSWGKWIEFFTRSKLIEYNNSYAGVIEEYGRMLGGGNAWFDTVTIKGSDFSTKGQIEGLINFVNFYFRAKKLDLKVEPAARVASSPQQPTMNQVVPLDVTGKLKGALGTPPEPPEKPAEIPSLLQAPEAEAAPAGGAPGAPPAGGAPGAPPAGGAPGAPPAGGAPR